MARRRRAQGKPIELFPFLAILACVIGVLTLLIAGLSLGALDIDLSGTEYARLEEKTARDLAEIDRLEQQREWTRIRGARAKHIQAELERRQRLAEEVGRLEEKLKGVQERRTPVVADRDRLREDLAKLQRELVSLESRLLGERRQVAGKRVEIRGPKARPGQRRLEPRFIECRGHVAVLDPDKGSSRARTVGQGDLLSSSHLRRLMVDVKRASRAIVILLVREGGVETSDLVAAILDSRDVLYGRLPVPSARDIDFSALAGGG